MSVWSLTPTRDRIEPSFAMKILSLILLASFALPMHADEISSRANSAARRAKMQAEADASALNGKIGQLGTRIDSLENDADQRAFDARRREERVLLAEEERLLALPVDDDIKAPARRYYSEILADKTLSTKSKDKLARQLLLGLGQIQDRRNKLQK